MIDVIDHVLSASPRYPDEIARGLVEIIWTTHRYLQGSTTKESPYEIEYCLRFAISEWLHHDYVITTTLTDEKDFHLKAEDPWEYVRKTIVGYQKNLPSSRLIFIGVPRLYKSMPLFCCALYHELGHFIDLSCQITETTLLLRPIDANIPEKFHLVMAAYRREHFADLFAACYVGSAIGDSLNAVNPNVGITLTHPPNIQRLELIRSFLAGEVSDELSMFQDALARRGLPALAQRFRLPEVYEAFNDIRPHLLAGPEQLHGIFPAAWSYMARALQGDGPPWTKGARPLEIIRIINDLAEKSIRNASIRQLWNGSP